MKCNIVLVAGCLLPCLSTSWLTATEVAAYEIEVRAKEAAVVPGPQTLRIETLDKRIEFPPRFSLVRSDGKRIAAQRVSSEPLEMMWWMDETLTAGERRGYRCDFDSRPADVVTIEQDDKRLLVKIGKRSVLQYNHAVVPSADSRQPLHARSGFIHPVYAPNQTVVTDGMPIGHMHQHGIMFAWRDTTFQDRHVNFWEDARHEGLVQHSEILRVTSGPVFGEFVVKLTHLDRTAPDGPLPVLSEIWRVRVYAATKEFVWELTSEQTALTDSPLIINKFHYGGFMVRGTVDWNDPAKYDFLVSNRLNRLEGNHSRPNWVDLHGRHEGTSAGMLVLGHPQNFRAPQPVRLHPTEPYFCFAPMVEEAFQIDKSATYRSQFRFVVHDGEPQAGHADEIWQQYSTPAEVTLRRAGTSVN